MISAVRESSLDQHQDGRGELGEVVVEVLHLRSNMPGDASHLRIHALRCQCLGRHHVIRDAILEVGQHGRGHHVVYVGKVVGQGRGGVVVADDHVFRRGVGDRLLGRRGRNLLLHVRGGRGGRHVRVLNVERNCVREGRCIVRGRLGDILHRRIRQRVVRVQRGRVCRDCGRRPDGNRRNNRKRHNGAQ